MERGRSVSTASQGAVSAKGVNDPGSRPSRRARGNQLRGTRMSRLWALPALIPVLALRYIAVGFGSYYAFTSWDGISIAAKPVGLDNFTRIFTDDVALRAILNTLLLAACAVTISNILGMLLAHALNTGLKTRHLLRAAFFAPFAITSLAVSYVWSFIFEYNGLLNQILGAIGLSSWRHIWTADPKFAIWTILVVMVWQLTGLCMIIYLSGLQSIPDEVIEAAELDGAGSFKKFRYVTLRMLRPAVVVSVALPTIMSLRVFDQIMGLTNGGPAQVTESMVTQFYRQAFASGQYGYGAAIALLLTLMMGAVAVVQILLLREKDA